MTNPGQTVRIRSRNAGRASVYEANMWCQKWQPGLFSGNGVTQNTSADLNVLVGGSSTNPDVVIARNAAGYSIALDLVSKQTLAITKPASNSRISSIVAYTNDLSLASTDTTTTGSPSSCGLIVVNGASSASPVASTDTEIRAAITADGATGSQATYCVIATITVASSTTTITNTLISLKKSTVISDSLGFSKTVDTNGWTVYDYGTWKEYRKRVTFTFSAQGPSNIALSSNNLPTGMASLGTNFLSATYSSTGNAYAVNWNAEMTSNETTLRFSYYSVTGAISQVGFIDVVIVG